ALASLRQWANHATRRGKDHEPLDLMALVRRWAAQASASEAGALEPLAPAVMRAAVPQPRAAPDDAPVLGGARAMGLGGWEAQRGRSCTSRIVRAGTALMGSSGWRTGCWPTRGRWVRRA